MNQTTRTIRAISRILCAALLACACAAGVAHADETEDLSRDLAPDEAQRLRTLLDAAPPAGLPPEAGVEAWLARVRAAAALSDPERQLAEITAGIAAIGARSPASFRLHLAQRVFNADRGNLVQARTAAEAMMAVANNPVLQLLASTGLASIQSVLHDRAGARASLARAQEALDTTRRRSPNWGRLGNQWQAMNAWANGQVSSNAGLYPEAEVAYQACNTSIRAHFRQNPDDRGPGLFYLADCSTQLIRMLTLQGKLQEAGALALEARQNAQRAADIQGRTLLVARSTGPIARVQIEQGRLDDAVKLLDQAIAQLRRDRFAESSIHLGSMRLLLASIEMLRGNWAKADALHRERQAGLLANREQSRRIGVLSVEWGYTLLRLERSAEALDVLGRVLTARTERYDERSVILWEGRAFQALAMAANGRDGEALRVLVAAVPKILELSSSERNSADSGVLRQARLNWILDGYIDLLMRQAHSGQPQSGQRIAGLDPAAEAFRIADLARGSSVQRALAAAASRARVDDPALAELIRREQDLQREVSALSDALGDLLARGRIAEQDKIVNDLRAESDRQRAAHAQVRRDIERRFPQYANLLAPQPLGVPEVQKLLRPGETLVSIFVGANRSHVWALPARGPVAHAVIPLGGAQIAERVSRLRAALDPGDVPITRMPRFDTDAAHELYNLLLAPVRAAWQDARELLVVPHGALGQLPLSVLLTRPFKPEPVGRMFAEFASAPWLARDVAVSQLPAVLALGALRVGASPARAERSFVGFGNPVFSTAGASPSAPGESARRNLAVVAARVERIENPEAEAVRLDLLQPLPDTALEIREIARTLKADEARDVFLEQRASERAVKSEDLARYRVVMFATHGLVPGELPGLYQPALALSNPKVTGESDDGLLTMGEILSLKLRADWVVLSACNTASGSGNGQEAVSGLGRAFFYAGARSLLVTHWPVETVSARLLTTDLFRREASGPARGRAQSLREASLDLMQRDNGNFSYAHPMFWAPFALYGDGAAER